MKKNERLQKDMSSSLLWTLFTPIDEITEENSESVIDWLGDKSNVMIWFTSIITGSIVLLTLFGNKPGFGNGGGLVFTFALSFMLFSVLCNLICVWKIPKWKFAVRSGYVTNGRKMVLDLEITSWLGMVFFLAALVATVLGTNLP